MNRTPTHVEIRPGKTSTKRLFTSSFLERISKTHIGVPITLFFLYSGAILYWSLSHTTLTILETLTLFVGGLFVFTWVEYNVHRYIFHIAKTTNFNKRMQYIIHGIHHDYPKDKSRLAMPPLLSITIATLLLKICEVVAGNFAFAFMSGFLIGYALYLFVHYLVHAHQTPNSWLKFLWINHAIHHHKDENVAFGVSSPLWDYVYGTTAASLKKRKN